MDLVFWALLNQVLVLQSKKLLINHSSKIQAQLSQWKKKVLSIHNFHGYKETAHVQQVKKRSLDGKEKQQ